MMSDISLQTLKAGDGYRFYRRRLTGARYKASCGQHYIVDCNGSLRRCDANGNIKPKEKKTHGSKKNA